MNRASKTYCKFGILLPKSITVSRGSIRGRKYFCVWKCVFFHLKKVDSRQDDCRKLSEPIESILCVSDFMHALNMCSRMLKRGFVVVVAAVVVDRDAKNWPIEGMPKWTSICLLFWIRVVNYNCRVFFDWSLILLAKN